MSFWRPQSEPQTQAARLIESFGWVDLFAGLVPYCLSLWRLGQFLRQNEPQPPFLLLGASLLISAWGFFFVIAGCANDDAVAPVLLLGAPVVPIALVLCARCLILGPLAYPVVIIDGAVAGLVHLCLLFRVRPAYPTSAEQDANLFYRLQARMFAIVSTLRGARTFHPDGTVYTGTVTPCDTESYQPISRNLSGRVLVRGGSGIDSRFVRQCFPRLNSPNLAVRFTNMEGGNRIDLLALSVGTSFSTAVCQLLGLDPFEAAPYDYFRNSYSLWLPYHTPNGGPNVRVQIIPIRTTQFSPFDFAGREAALRDAVAGRFAFEQPGATKPVFAVQVQPVKGKAWTTVAEFTLDAILATVDQEALHFEPSKNECGFEPYTWWTNLRCVVYPASVSARPGSQAERMRRRELSLGQRLALYLNGAPPVPDFESTRQP